jgi:hypothetical protein
VEEARQHPAVIVVALLAAVSWAVFLFGALVLVRGIRRGTIKSKGRVFQRVSEPAAFWGYAGIFSLFLMVPLLLGAVATYTLFGY